MCKSIEDMKNEAVELALMELVFEGKLSVKDAAEKCHLTVKEFYKKMKAREFPAPADIVLA